MNSRKLGYGIFDSTTKIIFVVVVAFIIIVGAKTAYYYGYHLFNQTAVYDGEGDGESVSITIEDGDKAGEIAEKLADAGLIKDKKLFKLQEKFSDCKGKEKAGTYTLTTKMTPEDMLKTMSGLVQNEDGTWVEATAESSSGGNKALEEDEELVSEEESEDIDVEGGESEEGEDSEGEEEESD
ncbi:MAG: endolytic transglycosylase MltG [Butyrivibrio sp.]|nr:endolytic transglycosylase MltG [Butyrivibrio sp.]